MNKKKYKLTISILASNRKDTLPKTLESLKPILDNVSSELIVVDTGCDEDLLEIVRQYTDKIEKFEWCKDFAKARNVGIDKAQGDWFMFIDDDEWFEDVTEFIEFFNSDEMYKYNYAKYVVRNYVNMEGTSWSDSIAGRMFRLFEGTRFVDAIHERPTNIASPTKSFTAFAHHYGYVYKSEEDRRAHVKRNTELLLEQIKKEPGIARHYCHLTQEYNNISEYEKSLEYAYQGIHNTDMSVKENIKDIAGLYGTVAWVLLNQLRYEEVIQKSEEYLAKTYLTELGRLGLYGFCATASFKLGKYDESIRYAEEFFKIKKIFDEDPDLLYKQDTILIIICASPENVERINGIAFAASIMSERVDDMLKYVENIGGGPQSLIDAGKCMKKLAENIAVTKEHEKYARILQRILSNVNYFNLVLKEVECMKDNNMDSFLNVADVMSYIDSNHGYVQFMTIISKRNDSKEILELLYEKAINDINDIINLHHHFWQIASARKIDISCVVDKKPISQWMEKVDEWAKNIKLADLIEKKQDLSMVLLEDGMHMKYFDVVLVENLLFRKKLENATLENIKMELVKYLNVIMNYYKIIYKEEVFEKYPSILPNRCQVAMIIANMLELNNKEEIENDVNKVIKLMPRLQPICDKYLELME